MKGRPPVILTPVYGLPANPHAKWGKPVELDGVPRPAPKMMEEPERRKVRRSSDRLVSVMEYALRRR